MCNSAEENQAHCCDPYGLRVQEQPYFLVCSSITIFTSTPHYGALRAPPRLALAQRVPSPLLK